MSLKNTLLFNVSMLWKDNINTSNAYRACLYLVPSHYGPNDGKNGRQHRNHIIILASSVIDGLNMFHANTQYL